MTADSIMDSNKAHIIDSRDPENTEGRICATTNNWYLSKSTQWWRHRLTVNSFRSSEWIGSRPSDWGRNTRTSRVRRESRRNYLESRSWKWKQSGTVWEICRVAARKKTSIVGTAAGIQRVTTTIIGQAVVSNPREGRLITIQSTNNSWTTGK